MILPLKEGAEVTVTETTGDYYVTSVAVNSGTAEETNSKDITVSDDATVDFIHYFPAVAPTGVVSRVAPYALMLGAGIALLVVLLIKKRKKKDDE